MEWSRRIKEWRARLQRENLRKSTEQKEYKKRIKRVYKESDRASPCNEALGEGQVIDIFY